MNKTKNVMGTKPVFPLLMSMAIPPMVSMLIQSMYNIVDSIFVAQLGEDALTAVSLAFPLQNLVLSVAVGLGVGLNAGIARNMGAGKQDMVDRTATHGIVFTAIHSLMFILIGIFCIKPFFRLFTDDPDIFKWGCQYTYIVICLSFGSLFQIAIEKMFQATGKMIMPMIMQAVGAIINIILDPILIFGLFGFPEMRVQGAAVATVIGQISACTLAIILFCKDSGGIHIKFKGFRFDKQITKQLYMVAIPSGIMTSMPSILIGILNGIISAVSGTAVAVLGIYFKLQTFVYMPANGVIQGMRPLISYNYGAKNNDRVKKAFFTQFKACVIFTCISWAIMMLTPQLFAGIFTSDKILVNYTAWALRIYMAGIFAMGFQVSCQQSFMALGQAKVSLILACLRKLILLIPLIFILPLIFPNKVFAVFLAEPVSDIIAAIVTTMVFMFKFNNILSENE